MMKISSERRPALFLATRMKRLAERMQSESMRLVREHALPIQPSNVDLLATLYESGPQTIGEMARLLKLTQPTVTSYVASLIDQGLVELNREHADQRFKTITLTDAGRNAWIRSSVLVMSSLELAVEELLSDLTGPFLSNLERLEKRLDERSMDQRALAHRGEGIRIRPYSDDLNDAFKKLTAEWMTDEGLLSEGDLEAIANPMADIIGPGGAVLFAEVASAGVIGVGALRKIDDDGAFELVHLGITKAARGAGVGEKLMRALIDRAQELGAKTLFLLSREQLKPALKLYEKMGFIRSEEIMTRYGGRDARVEVAMRHNGAPSTLGKVS